jgi:ApbE superfamily uncharacterized protein (UPF0280 family)
MYKERAYRRWVKSDGLVSFEAVVKETDLFVSADSDLKKEAVASIMRYRGELEDYIMKHEDFLTSLEPVEVKADAPEIAKVMAAAAKKAGVGPMAAVAGAMAEFVGRGLLKLSGEIVVENGGDIFLKINKKRSMGIFAGERSPFTGKLAIEIEPDKDGVGVCTSSGTVSHSLSFGNADAALIISDNAALADAMATATGNLVKSASDIEKGVAFAKSVEGVRGVLIIVGDKLGSWGDIKLI